MCRNQDSGVSISQLSPSCPQLSCFKLWVSQGAVLAPGSVSWHTLPSPGSHTPLSRAATHARFTWLSMRSSTSDVLPSSASTIARIPDPEMKFDSTFRLFSVLLTFNISARACGQRWAGGAGSQTGRGRAPQGSRASAPLTSRVLLEHPTRCAVSLPPGGNAVCGVKGAPSCCRGMLEHEPAGGHSKTSHGQHLGLPQKVTVHTCSCPVMASSVPPLKPAWYDKNADQHWPCLHCTGLRCFPLKHAERGASVLNSKGSPHPKCPPKQPY